MSIRLFLEKYLHWCPGVEVALNYSSGKKDEIRKLILLGITITLLSYGGAYFLFLQPEPEQTPLIITIDDQDVSSVDFCHYDFSNFYKTDVNFELPINLDEYAPSGTNEYEKTVYEFEDWDEAFSVLNTTETPEIVIAFAKWLGNGTHIEVAEKFYGSVAVYNRYSPLGSIQHFFGTHISHSTCYFSVERSQSTIELYEELGTSERIIIEKGDSPAPPIWIFAVEISDSPPYTVLLIRFTK